VSVALGLARGIKWLSQGNMVLALGLALFLFVAGPTVFLLDSFIQNLGYYIQRFIYLSTWTESYTGGEWQIDWTIFYYAWWISWSPFVGIFIARISYGRTIREFVLGTLLVPVLFTFLWMTIFGDSALYIELFGDGGISEAVAQSMPDALFAFLSHYPLTSLLAAVAIVIIATFFVTSADSGALVVAMIASGGDGRAGGGPAVRRRARRAADRRDRHRPALRAGAAGDRRGNDSAGGAGSGAGPYIASTGRRCGRGRSSLEHRAKKWEPVFAKSDAATKIYSIASDSDIAHDAVGATKLPSPSEEGPGVGLVAHTERLWRAPHPAATNLTFGSVSLAPPPLKRRGEVNSIRNANTSNSRTGRPGMRAGPPFPSLLR
jgi:hypothetical protein